MEKITTKNQLVVLIKNLISVEILARDRYDNESNKFDSEKIVSVLKKIKKDEDRHIELLEDLVSKFV